MIEKTKLKTWENRVESKDFEYRVKDKLEEKLKGENFTSPSFSIFYDFKEDKFFTVLKASGNWGFNPAEDTEGYVRIYHAPSSSDTTGNFTLKEYFYDDIRSNKKIYKEEAKQELSEEEYEKVKAMLAGNVWKNLDELIALFKKTSIHVRDPLDIGFDWYLNNELVPQAMNKIQDFLARKDEQRRVINE